MRFYLVDKVLEMELGKSIKGVKCWTMSDEIFSEHFPGFPVVPGVLLVESIAQLLGVLIDASFKNVYPDKNEVYVILSMIHKAKFRDVVVPGDKCELHGTLSTIDYNRATGSGEIFVDGKLAAQIELSFALISKEVLPENNYIEKRRREYTDVIMMKKPERKK
jgi:3-hydroxyacyl-[acyl-carrier-protein] dehydratase